jgi:hypothetical protein
MFADVPASFTKASREGAQEMFPPKKVMEGVCVAIVPRQVIPVRWRSGVAATIEVPYNPWSRIPALARTFRQSRHA